MNKPVFSSFGTLVAMAAATGLSPVYAETARSPYQGRRRQFGTHNPCTRGTVTIPRRPPSEDSRPRKTTREMLAEAMTGRTHGRTRRQSGVLAECCQPRGVGQD